MNCWCRRRSRSERTRGARVAGALLVAALLAVPGRCVAAAVPTARFRVVVSADVADTSLTVTELGRIVLGLQRHWRNRQPLALLLPGAQSPARRFLLERLARMSEAAYRRHTLQLLYRGELEYAPKVVASDEELVALVAAGNGALALVRDGTWLPPEVRTLKVNGCSPEDAGYPLRN